MALPSVSDLKTYLRKEDTTAEDALLTQLLARAGAAVRRYLDRPIEAATKTYVIQGDSARAWPQFTKLIVPDTPLDPDSVEILDTDGNQVDPALYTVDGEVGVIRAVAGEAFRAFPYEVTADVGLAIADDYATVAEPLLGAAILDYAAELYQHRNPLATQESELGITTSYANDGLPMRVRVALSALRRAG